MNRLGNTTMTTTPDVNLWRSAEHALDYLRHADAIPHRVEGESTLLEFVPAHAKAYSRFGQWRGKAPCAGESDSTRRCIRRP